MMATSSGVLKAFRLAASDLSMECSARGLLFSTTWEILWVRDDIQFQIMFGQLTCTAGPFWLTKMLYPPSSEDAGF